MKKTVFVAATYREAVLWAVQWGFSPATYDTDWYWVGRPEHTRGIYNAEKNPAFVCGSGDIHPDVLLGLEQAGYTEFVDAHDLGTFYEHRSALDLL